MVCKPKDFGVVEASVPTIEEIAKVARQEAAQVCHVEDGDFEGMCSDASEILLKKLREYGYDANRVVGTYVIDDPKELYYGDDDDDEEEQEDFYHPMHHWVEVAGVEEVVVIDITADQFNDEMDDENPPVVIGTYSDLWRYEPKKVIRAGTLLYKKAHPVVCKLAWTQRR